MAELRDRWTRVRCLDEFRDWKLLLYDFMYEHRERMEKVFDELDTGETKSGLITADSFKQALESEGLLVWLRPDDVKEICEKHEKERNEIDFASFLIGKKYVAKAYLMTAFAGKKKKKKKPKNAKKQKGALPSRSMTTNRGDSAARHSFSQLPSRTMGREQRTEIHR